MNAIGCLGIILFGIVLMIYGAIRNIYYAAFGHPADRQRRQSQPGQKSSGPTMTEGRYDKPHRRSGDNRIYPDSVGEYVDYEEVT